MSTLRRDTLVNEGCHLFNQGDNLGARFHFEAALKIDPNNALALSNLAVVHRNENHLQLAEALYRKSIALAPAIGDRWSEWGNILMHLGDFEEAESIMESAAELAPDRPGVWHNFSILMQQLRRHDEAITYLERAKVLSPDDAVLDNDLAFALLAKGENFPHTFEVYENRWHFLNHLLPWDFHISEWQGQDLTNKAILFHSEQGFGDALMLLRYVPQLMARGAHVVVGVNNTMIQLVHDQGWNALDIGTMTAEDAAYFDYHTPMFSAMRWLGIKDKGDISGAPYLTAPASDLEFDSNLFNVGICWASGSRNNPGVDWRRRISHLNDWLPLASIPGVKLYSLQKGTEDTLQVDELGAGCLVEELHCINTWADTASVMQSLDLVISVDTAVPHLSAALGRPTWLISQFSPCWRWWNIDRESGLPWYDSMRILRQPSRGDWTTPLATCREWLVEEVRQKQNLRQAA